MRRALVVATTTLLACLLLPALPAGAQRTREAQVPKQLAEAQRRANAAAARLSAGQSQVARVERQVRELQARADQNEATLGKLEGEVKALVVRQYVQGNGNLDLLGAGDIGEAARARAMIRFVRLGDTDAIDAYRAAREDMDASKGALDKTLEEQKATLAALRADRAAAMKELNRLAAIQKEIERKAAAAAAARARRAGRSVTPARGSTGGGAARIIGSGSWICPVQGPRSFSNDWGAPRSGGRRHQGTDILAPRGTPVVASVAGSVRHHNSSRGGLSYYLRGVDGHTYFGTHLSGYASQGQVAAGTVVGYVGTTGNASGGPPHLHFEIHPGGGGPTNPYPTLRANC